MRCKIDILSSPVLRKRRPPILSAYVLHGYVVLARNDCAGVTRKGFVVVTRKGYAVVTRKGYAVVTRKGYAVPTCSCITFHSI
jgi:hypothetical protein